MPILVKPQLDEMFHSLSSTTLSKWATPKSKCKYDLNSNLLAALVMDRKPILLWKIRSPTCKPFLLKHLLSKLLRISIPTTYSMGALHENECKLEENWNYYAAQIWVGFQGWQRMTLILM